MKCIICEQDASVALNEINEYSDGGANIVWYLCRKHYIAARDDKDSITFEQWRDGVLKI